MIDVSAPREPENLVSLGTGESARRWDQAKEVGAAVLGLVRDAAIVVAGTGFVAGAIAIYQGRH